MELNENVLPLSPVTEVNDMLTETIRQGAKKMLAAAVEIEVSDFIEQFKHIKDDRGRRQVVRNGYLPARTVQTGVGDVDVKAPRVRDHSGQEISFHSSLLPAYLKRTQSVDKLIPWLYLKGVSTGDMSSSLGHLLGKNASGLSAKNITHLTSVWQQEYTQWCHRDLSALNIVYIWADGVYLKARMDGKQCLLVIIGADESGKKHVLAIETGQRESSLSWQEVLLNMRKQGLDTEHIKLATGDGAMGFWSALTTLCPEVKHQRCWVHKTANILNKLPKSLQSSAKEKLHEIWMSSTQEDAEKTFDVFVQLYDAKYPKVTQCLAKDRDALLAFYDFPAQHWHHLRTTNPIESMFATVKLRTAKTRGCLSRKTGLAMVYKLAMAAQDKWPRLRGSALVADVIHGVKFQNGMRQNDRQIPQELQCAA